MIIALVGMCGSGKSEAAELLGKKGFKKIRFGDVTDEEVEKRGLSMTEKNERMVREDLRRIHGMHAFAKLSMPRIKAAVKKSNVILDGLYSMEEYEYLKSELEKLIIVAIYASPATRYKRLAKRKIRPLSRNECVSRDISEIKNLNKGGPIAMADFTVKNEGNLKDMQKEIETVLECLQ
ncbi:MAG TPA: AAA family ATPase [archaeon]|nr:AAA family ATPase [archaeon]